MKLNLNIEEDKELRSYIKDMIKGQVLSVVREDVKEALNTVLNNEISKINTKIGDMILNEIKRRVTSVLETNTSWSETYIKKITREYINTELSKIFANKDKEKV